MSSGTIRVGVIGMGHRGVYFARMYDRASHPGFELKAVCDMNPARLASVRERYGNRLSYYESHDALVNSPEVDAVIVATNDPHHVAPTLAALAAGKHVMVEKPLCQSLDEARTILRVASQAPGIFLIGFELRECPLFQVMKGLLDEGRIGPVLVAHAFDNVSVGGQYYFHNPGMQKAFYRSLLLQKASHSLDLLNWMIGSDPSRVYAIGGQAHYGRLEDPQLRCGDCDRAASCPQYTAGVLEMDYGGNVARNSDYCVWGRQMDLDDHSLLAITYANGAHATFHEVHFTPEYSREFWLVGPKGKMYGYYDNPGRFLVRIEYSHDRARRTEEFKPPFRGGDHGGGDNRLRDEFHRRILENDPPREAARSAYYSTALALCAQQSIDSGEPINIPLLEEEVGANRCGRVEHTGTQG